MTSGRKYCPTLSFFLLSLHFYILLVTVGGYTLVDRECQVGHTSLIYLGPSNQTGTKAEKVLLNNNFVETGYRLDDPLTGRQFTTESPFIGENEIESIFRLDHVAVDAANLTAACVTSLASADLSRMQWSVTVDVTNSDILDKLELTPTIANDDSTNPTATSGTLLPLAHMSPSTSTALALPANASTTFKLTYTCSSRVAGNLGIILHIGLMVPNSVTGELMRLPSYTIKFSKTCAPTSCDGLCHHGVCNPLTAKCECEPEYNLDPFCTYSFRSNTTEVCAFEPFRVSWDTQLARESDPSSANDWISILGPSRSCVGCNYTIPLAIQEYWAGYQPEWFYIGSFSTSYPAQPQYTGDFEYRMKDDLPGQWAFVLFLSDSTTEVMAIATVTQLARHHPRCVALADQRRSELAQVTVQLHAQIQSNLASQKSAATVPSAFVPFALPASGTSESRALVLSNSTLTLAGVVAAQPCIAGEYNSSTGACTCPTGRYGPMCEYGCSSDEIVRVESFGGEFSTTDDGLSLSYINNANCRWLIHVPSPATGMMISFPYVATEATDILTVAAGNSDDTTTYTPSATVSGLYVTGLSNFDLSNHTYALVTFKADFSHDTLDWNTFTGAKIKFQAIGCPSGSHLKEVVTLRGSSPLGWSQQYQCLPCQPGTVNPRPDSPTCLPCQPSTYAPNSGMTECLPVAPGFFQRYSGASTMESCIDESWPSECMVSPYPIQAKFTVFILFLLVTLTMLFVMMALIWHYRTQRVIFHASPQFLIGMLAALAIFTVGLLLHALPQTKAICNAKLFLLYPSPSLLLGCLLVRQYRLHRIFNNIVLKTVKLPVWKLWSVVGVAVAIDIIALIVLVGVMPYDVPSSDFPECTSDQDGSLGLLIALLSIKALLCLLLLGFSWKTRTIPQSYNEVKSMSLTSANILVVAGIIVVTSFGDTASGSSSGSIVTSQIALSLYAVGSTALFLFGMKFYRLYEALLLGKSSLGGESKLTIDSAMIASSGSNSLPAQSGPMNFAYVKSKNYHASLSPPPSDRISVMAMLSSENDSTRRTRDRGTAAWTQSIIRAHSPSQLDGSKAPSPPNHAPAEIESINSPSGATSPSAKLENKAASPNPSVMSDGAIVSSPVPRRKSLSGTRPLPSFPARPIPRSTATVVPLPFIASDSTLAAANSSVSTNSPRLNPSSPSPKPGSLPQSSSLSIRSRYAATRQQVQTLQSDISKLQQQLSLKEKQLAKANNQCMTFAFELEAREH